jgi:hypothetical protein
MGVLGRRSDHRIDSIFEAYRSTEHVQSGKSIGHDLDTSPDVVVMVVHADAWNSER